jgi:uncharacterized protein
MISAFSLSTVRLLPGPCLTRQDRNKAYLLDLEPDRLLLNFRTLAGIPSPNATPLGGWEAPDHGLRGHFVGHYLSALGQMFSTTGDARLCDRCNQMVAELGKCQGSNGYLAAFAESDLDVIETQFAGAWASYYVLHKMLQGLIDAHCHCRSPEALDMASRLAGYVKGRINKLPADQVEKMLRTDRPNPTNEIGAWSESLQELYRLTGDPEHCRLAEIFDVGWFLEPLKAKRDVLSGLHANTHVAIAIGAARRFIRTGDESLKSAVECFWERTALARSYVNGGSSGPRPDGKEKSVGGEHWPDAGRLAGTLTPKINESCVTHNMIKLSELLFRWSRHAGYMDFIERAYFNSVLTMQHPGYLGGYIYDHPLGNCSHKVFGHADDAFWCCYGSTIEAYSRLQANIYHHAEDGSGLYIDLPLSSSLDWAEKGISLVQEAILSDHARQKVTFKTQNPITLTVNIRIPPWALHPGITVNGAQMTLTPSAAKPGEYFTITRLWHNEDIIEVTSAMTPRMEAMPDDPNLVAFLYGPFVLAGRSDKPLVIRRPERGPLCSLLRPAGANMFTMCLADGSEIMLAPLHTVAEETFGVYMKVEA